MHEVQKACFDRNGSPEARISAVGPPRFLEGADGHVTLCWGERALAHARAGGAWRAVFDGESTFRVLRVQDVRWTHTCALALLQGASLRQVLGARYFPFWFHARPSYSTRPGLEELFVGEPLFPVPPDGEREYYAKLLGLRAQLVEVP